MLRGGGGKGGTLKGQQVKWSPTFDWLEKHMTLNRPRVSHTTLLFCNHVRGPIPRECTDARDWGLGRGHIAPPTGHAQSIMGVSYSTLLHTSFPCLDSHQSHDSKNTRRCTEHNVFLRHFSWRVFELRIDSREGWRRRSWESNAWTSADCEINHWMEGKHVYGGSNFKGSHGAYFGKFTVSMLEEKGNLFMAWWTCVMITVMLCKLECLLELFKITFAFSCRCTNPPTATASMSLFCLERCLLPSWRTCHTGGCDGDWRGKRNTNTVPIDLQNLWLPPVKHIQRDTINLLHLDILRSHWITYRSTQLHNPVELSCLQTGCSVANYDQWRRKPLIQGPQSEHSERTIALLLYLIRVHISIILWIE